MFVRKMLLLSLIMFSFFKSQALIIPATTVPVQKETKSPAFSKLSVKTLENALHRKLKFKEKIALFLYNHKIIKAPQNNENELKGAALGKKSLTYALGGWVLTLLGILLPFVGILGIISFVLSTVFGIRALKYKKGDNNATIGLVLSGVYFLLLIIGLILVFAIITTL